MIHPAIKSKFHSLLFDTALFLLLTCLLQGILYLCGFRLREYLKIIRLVILCVGLVGGILQKMIAIPKKSSRMILLCIFVISLLLFAPIGRELAWFFYQPEHIVERDGKTYVDYVSMYFETYVDYYEYKNCFLTGSQAVIHEDYGNGSFDPLRW